MTILGLIVTAIAVFKTVTKNVTKRTMSLKDDELQTVTIRTLEETLPICKLIHEKMKE